MNLLFSLFTFAFALCCWAQGPETEPMGFASAQQAFETGLQSYKNRNFVESKRAFEWVLKNDRNNHASLINLALTEYELKNPGLAVALLRHSFEIQSNNEVGEQAYKFIWSKLPVKEIPHQITTWELIRDWFLRSAGLNWYLGLTLLTLFAFGWSLINLLSARKKSVENGEVPPGLHWVQVILAVTFICMFGLSLAKLVDLNTPRATIVPEKVAVMSSPDIESTSLFDLYAGLEVIVLRQEKDWAQVKYPGSYSGWVPISSIYITTGEALW